VPGWSEDHSKFAKLIVVCCLSTYEHFFWASCYTVVSRWVLLAYPKIFCACCHIHLYCACTVIDWSIDLRLGWDLMVPMRLGLNWQALCAAYRFMGALLLYQSSRWLPRLILLMSSGSMKEPSYACLSEAKVSHSHRMWAEVSSSALHLLHNGLSDSPISWRCLLRVLCSVRRPVTATDCALLKDRNLNLAPRQGPKINSRACLCVSPSPCHHIQSWLTNQCLTLRISCLETPKAVSGLTNIRTEPSLASLSVTSLPHTPACAVMSCAYCYHVHILMLRCWQKREDTLCAVARMTAD